jgi:DNA-binding transcriptional MerR regulator
MGVLRRAMAAATPRAGAIETPNGDAATRSASRCHGFYQTRDVVDILGISRRQLQYWAQTDLLVPSATTRGGHRRYSFEDLVALKAAKRLIDAGVSLQRIRRSIHALRQTLPSVEQPLSELVLVATGDIVLVFRDGSAFEAVSGQEWVFEVAAFEREVAAWNHPSKVAPDRKVESERVAHEQSGRAGSQTA